MEALKTLKFVNQRELGDALGMSQPTISRALRKAAASGETSREHIGRLFNQAKELQADDGRDDPFDVEDRVLRTAAHQHSEESFCSSS